MQLSELDLFKASSESPRYIQNLQSIEKTMYKVWSGLTKYIRSTIQKDKIAICTEFGKFIPTSPVKYIPSGSFLNLGKLLYKSASDIPANIAYKEQTISYSSIAEVCSIERDSVIQCLKEILYRLVEQVSIGNTVTLHFKVGDLIVKKGWVEFGGVSSFEKPDLSVYQSVDTPKTEKRSLFNDSSAFHPSNPNPLHQGPSSNLNNYYRGLKYKTDNTLLAPVAFYTGQIHPVFNFRNKFTRKQACEQPLSPDELYKIHQDQIAAKKLLKKQEKEKEIEEHNKTIQNFYGDIITEKNTKNIQEIEKRKEYANANIEQSLLKLDKQKLELEKKKAETYDYFPFTHGDQAEAKRKAIKDELKLEFQSHLKSLESSFTPNKDPVVAVPKFLQASEYQNIRKNQNQNLEKVMKGALETYKNELDGKEKEILRLKREKEYQDAQDSIYYKQLEIYRKKEIDDNTKALEGQIQDKISKKNEESLNKKNLYNTSLEISPPSPEKIKLKQDYYQEYQKYLISQMEKKSKAERENLIKERELDYKIITNVDDYINLEDNQNKLMDTYTKSLNKDVWIKQMKIKNLEKDVGKIL